MISNEGTLSVGWKNINATAATNYNIHCGQCDGQLYSSLRDRRNSNIKCRNLRSGVMIQKLVPEYCEQ